MMGRLEMFEENWKVIFQVSFYFGDDVYSVWGDIVKMEVVLGLLDVEFIQIQKVYKDVRGDVQFVWIKVEMNVMY